jgi:hypothetical protein
MLLTSFDSKRITRPTFQHVVPKKKPILTFLGDGGRIPVGPKDPLVFFSPHLKSLKLTAEDELLFPISLVTKENFRDEESLDLITSFFRELLTSSCLPTA